VGTLCLQPDRHVCSVSIKIFECLFFRTACPGVISGSSSIMYFNHITHVLYIVEFINNIAVEWSDYWHGMCYV
jgi:hypothetical protein